MNQNSFILYIPLGAEQAPNAYSIQTTDPVV
jgi:hypothetical protein